MYDTKCSDLAEEFLQEVAEEMGRQLEPARVAELAQQIQDTIELYLADVEAQQ